MCQGILTISITEHKGYDKKVLSMYENVFFEMLERIIQLENEKE